MDDLKNNKFSINVDECTASNNSKVFTILVSYFSEEAHEVVIDYYDSISLTTCNAQTLKVALMKLLNEDGIPLDNLVSSLSDSASVMRGAKGGFEALMRREAPHLQDVGGDTCHHLHNTVKRFCEHFNKVVEKLMDDLHTEFKYSQDLRAYLHELCIILDVK